MVLWYFEAMRTLARKVLNQSFHEHPLFKKLKASFETNKKLNICNQKMTWSRITIAVVLR